MCAIIFFADCADCADCADSADPADSARQSSLAQPLTSEVLNDTPACKTLQFPLCSTGSVSRSGLEVCLCILPFLLQISYLGSQLPYVKFCIFALQ